MPTIAGGTAASEWRIGQPLNVGIFNAIPISAGQTLNGPAVDVCADSAELTVTYEMTGGASADLTIYVWPVKSDGTIMTSIPLPAIRSIGPTFGSGVVQFSGTYDVSGYKKVQLAAKNSNAGAQTINEVRYRIANMS